MSSGVGREIIEQVARTFLGVRYMHQGRSRRGLDCSGLVVATAKDAGIPVRYDRTNYPRIPKMRNFEEELARGLDQIELDDIGIGDVGVFWITPKRQLPQHCCIFTSRGMIHAHTPSRRVVEHIFAPFWKERLVSAFAIPGVDRHG